MVKRIEKWLHTLCIVLFKPHTELWTLQPCKSIKRLLHPHFICFLCRHFVFSRAVRNASSKNTFNPKSHSVTTCIWIIVAWKQTKYSHKTLCQRWWNSGKCKVFVSRSSMVRALATKARGCWFNSHAVTVGFLLSSHLPHNIKCVFITTFMVLTIALH